VTLKFKSKLDILKIYYFQTEMEVARSGRSKGRLVVVVAVVVVVVFCGCLIVCALWA